jgi:hypothetical protein
MEQQPPSGKLVKHTTYSEENFEINMINLIITLPQVQLSIPHVQKEAFVHEW